MRHHNGVGSQALSCTLCSCSMLLGTMSTCQTPLLASESSCLFSLILNINSIFHVNFVHAKTILILNTGSKAQVTRGCREKYGTSIKHPCCINIFTRDLVLLELTAKMRSLNTNGSHE